MVTIPRNAFRFCKVTITLLVWVAFIFRIESLVLAAFMLLLASAILKIKRAPLIVLYSTTFNKFIPSKEVELDEKGMRFAHTLGAIFSGICVLLVYLDLPKAWGVVLALAIMKTISMFGYCPGEKIYKCMKDGGCCRITRK